MSYETDYPPIRLSRDEADTFIREQTDRYYQLHGVDNTSDRFNTFTLWLSWRIGGRIEQGELLDVIDAQHELVAAYYGDRPGVRFEDLESALNETVNQLLDTAHIPGTWILRDYKIGKVA